jgi:hypothetical protein
MSGAPRDRPVAGLYLRFTVQPCRRVTMDGQTAVPRVAEKGHRRKIFRHWESAVSKRAQSLEAAAGTPLFRTVGRGMLPIEAGYLYLMSSRNHVGRPVLAWIVYMRFFGRRQTTCALAIRPTSIPGYST